MLILLTNDDGIYAPGLAALQRELAKLGEVCVVAPSTEQSGVGHTITYLTPLIVKEVFQNERMAGGSDDRWGWAVEGSPADCVKIGVAEFCPRRPDLVVSGINAGLNAGINVLYSGTVAAAIEGAFFGITSIAVSLQYERHFQFEKAACLARQIIEQILAAKGPEPQLYNINIPTAALSGEPQVRVVPMNVTRYGDRFEKRRTRSAVRIIGSAAAGPRCLAEHETDLSAIAQGTDRGHAAGLQHDQTNRSDGDGEVADPPLPAAGKPRRREADEDVFTWLHRSMCLLLMIGCGLEGPIPDVVTQARQQPLAGPSRPSRAKAGGSRRKPRPRRRPARHRPQKSAAETKARHGPREGGRGYGRERPRLRRRHDRRAGQGHVGTPRNGSFCCRCTRQ